MCRIFKIVLINKKTKTKKVLFCNEFHFFSEDFLLYLGLDSGTYCEHYLDENETFYVVPCNEERSENNE